MQKTAESHCYRLCMQTEASYLALLPRGGRSPCCPLCPWCQPWASYPIPGPSSGPHQVPHFTPAKDSSWCSLAPLPIEVQGGGHSLPAADSVSRQVASGGWGEGRTGHPGGREQQPRERRFVAACGSPRGSPATKSQPGCGSDASHHTWGWAGSQAHRRLGKRRPSVGIREGWRGTGGKHLVAASLSFFF